MSSNVSARLADHVVAELDRRADEQMRSRSNLVALLVTKGLAEPAEGPEEEPCRT